MADKPEMKDAIRIRARAVMDPISEINQDRMVRTMVTTRTMAAAASKGGMTP